MLKDLKQEHFYQRMDAFMQDFLTPIDLYKTYQNLQLTGTQTDSFRVLQQSLCGNFELSADSRNPRIPAFRMYAQRVHKPLGQRNCIYSKRHDLPVW